MSFYKEDMKVSTLYSWVSGESDLLSYWLLSLKGGGRRKTWKWAAYKMLAGKFQELPAHCVVVPAPPTKKGQKDHAYEWGKALAELIGADFAPCLEKAHPKSQKKASVMDRENMSLQLIENYSGLERVTKGTLWIFADDILTTGSTARAARKALGFPPHFETWVLAQRKLSCGASKHLL